MISGRLVKGKSPFLWAILVVLVALAAFGLGRLSAQPQEQGGVIIHMPGDAAH